MSEQASAAAEQPAESPVLEEPSLPPALPQPKRKITPEQLIGAAELYWPGLGGRVGAQWAEWNTQLFEGALEPEPMVLSRMSSVHGHWFPFIDIVVDQRRGHENEWVSLTANMGYQPPSRLRSVSRAHLLRGMMGQSLRQRGLQISLRGQDWCDLVMRLHKALRNETIWAAPTRQEFVDTSRPAERVIGIRRVQYHQDLEPQTGRQSLSRTVIAARPASLFDLGFINAAG